MMPAPEADSPALVPSKVFILTGSGISAESGVRTYRGDLGLWEEHRIADVATPEGFRSDPDRVRSFYDARYTDIAAAVPNAAHEALSRLEAHPAFDVTIVTQNIDDLHERAGSRNVVHIHGAITRALCAGCGLRMDHRAGKLSSTPSCPECGKGLRPDITWFGEIPQRMNEIESAFMAAGLFLMIGTSGEVMPAGDYARRARNRKLKRVEFNLGATGVSHHFRDWRRGPASTTLPAYVDGLLRAVEAA